MGTLTRQEARDKLCQWLDSRRAQLADDTSKLLQFETVSGGKTEQEKAKFNQERTRCLKFLEELAKNFGLGYRNYDDIVAVIECKAPSERSMGILTHIDVVPAGRGWTHPPFGGNIVDDIVWGRGTTDDKGPTMSSLYAMAAANQLGVEFNRSVKLVLGTQEEIGIWDDMRLFLKQEGAPDFSFTPDANFPIINGEKGMMTPIIRAGWESSLPHDNGLSVSELKGGERANMVPDYAEMRLSCPITKQAEIFSYIETCVTRFLTDNPKAKIEFSKKSIESGNGDRSETELIFKGLSAHGSRPFDGQNAILDALHFISYLNLPKQPLTLCADFLHRACSELYGRKFNIYHKHHFIGETTVNLGIINLEENGVEARVNIRQPIGITIPEIMERINNVINEENQRSKLNMSAELPGSGTEPLFVDPEENKFFISSLQEAFQAITSLEPKLQSIGGTTFAKAFPNCVSFGPILFEAGEKEIAHQTDEHVTIDHLLRNAKIYAYAIALLSTNLG